MTDPVLLGEVAQQVAMASGWAVLESADSSRRQFAEYLLKELQWQDEALTTGEAVVYELTLNGDDLLNFLQRCRSSLACIVVCTAEQLVSVAPLLEAGRSRFVAGPRVVFITEPGGAAALARAAPNVWSWIGARLWLSLRLSPEIDAQSRLSALRREFQLTDEDIIARAIGGTLGSDPVSAEWLALLGRGDLIGR
jgi:hypothetical protein